MKRDITWVISAAAVAASLAAGIAPGRADGANLKECERVEQDAKIACYTRVAEEPGASAETRVTAYTLRSLTFDAKGEYEPASADAARAIEIDPKYEKAYFARGLAYHHKGEVDPAIADYGAAIELAPGTPTR